MKLPPVHAHFVTGSQHLYGPEALARVAEDARRVVDGLNRAGTLSVPLVWQPTATTSDEVAARLAAADADDACVGVVAWMHTFSPAKMWINALDRLDAPLCHLHTQLERDIPWATIDMDFMNLHQSAHGGREFGHACARAGVRRVVIAGHWEAQRVQHRLDVWLRAARARHDSQRMKVARLGDNMRHVAVTEGDKVEAQRVFGYQVNGYGLGELGAHMADVADVEVERLCEEYEQAYHLAAELHADGNRRDSLRKAARIELALRSFLDDGGFTAFTDTFENLHGLEQLPGLAVQRLMQDGYGFGAEGDWKTAALVRSAKVMAEGLPGGTSFMEDYVYHFDPASPGCLGAHMLEVCPSIAAERERCEVHPLGIGGKADPVRLVFDGEPGQAVNASIVDLGDRFRLLINSVNAKAIPEAMPSLPVARVFWEPEPSLEEAAERWILAGGAHHTAYSRALTAEHFRTFGAMHGVETVEIA
ncbi:MAG: L-arabinose isomerase [Planctomycetota bacterium]